jgi:hypothetical protein
MVNRTGGREADGVSDLADRRRVATLLDRESNAVENSLPSLSIVPGQDHPPLFIRAGTLAERMF